MSFFSWLHDFLADASVNTPIELQCNPEVVAYHLQEAKAYLERESQKPKPRVVPELDPIDAHCIPIDRSCEPSDSTDFEPGLFREGELPETKKYVKLSELVTAVPKETFVQALRFHIYRKGLIAPEVYRAAQMDKRLFSKIISNTNYKPIRDTVIALAFALHLNADEADVFLSRAGYALSKTNRRDVILSYFFQQAEKPNLAEINSVLESFEELPIGRG